MHLDGGRRSNRCLSKIFHADLFPSAERNLSDQNRAVLQVKLIFLKAFYVPWQDLHVVESGRYRINIFPSAPLTGL